MIYKFHQALLQCGEKLEGIESVLKNYLENLGFTIYSFTYYNRHANSANKIKYDLFSNRHKIWHQHYLEENYQEIDSVLAKERKQILPILWHAEDLLKNATHPREYQMRLDSIKFGVEKGLSIPVHGYLEDFANLLLVQMRGETCLENWETLQYDLMVIAKLFCHFIQKPLIHAQRSNLMYQLTDREIQCLTLTARQTSVKEIAEKLRITPRTVNFHIQKLNKKLGVNNKHQAVAKALEKQLILI